MSAGMIEKLQKKLSNIYVFLDLFRMQTKMPYDEEKALKTQNKKICRLVKKAYEIPFYRERFDRAGVKPGDIKNAEDLNKLPLLTKDELREWMNEEAKNPEYDNWYKDTTSGSSGIPLMILLSPREKAYMKANWLRVMQVAGYNPFTGRTMSRINAHDEKTGPDTFLQKFGILRRKLVNQYDKVENVVKEINAYQPDFLYMNKTELMRICLYCSQHGLKVFHPKFYAGVGEKVDDTARKLFREVLGPGIVDSYGTAETGACMVRLFGSSTYTIHRDSFVVNLVDDNGKLADEGKVVITPLFKTDMPLINYVVGDRAEAGIKDGVRVISNVKGRMNDFFHHEDGQVTTFFEVTPVIAHNPDVLQIRFIQETYHDVTVQCVFNEKESSKTKEQVEEELSRQLNAIFKQPFNLTFHWMDVIPPDPNGKLRMIVCKVK